MLRFRAFISNSALTPPLKFKVQRFREVDSTNSVAFRHAREGASSGSVFVAEYQTQGRGQWGREWLSARGKNLLFSVLLRTNLKAIKATGVTQVACRSVAQVLKKHCGLEPTFKRPNDVLVGGRKVCGVLVEAKGRSNGDLESLVIGIGLNVNAAPSDLATQATSLKEQMGKRQSRTVLFTALLRQLEKDLKCYSS